VPLAIALADGLSLKVVGLGEHSRGYFTSLNVVKQRLRLASVSKALLDVCPEDGMSLERFMAFTVSADHARQEQVWAALKKWSSKEPYRIRHMLAERAARAPDGRAEFVGLDAYEAAPVSDQARPLFNLMPRVGRLP
jgi:ParB family chromosome partitioning protein